MLTRTIFGLVLVCFLILTLTPVSFAVSEASALFLRIASGARAAGMGEAFVAVADDATATHWNPAGLGAYPLSYSWKDGSVPLQYRPLKEVAVLKKENSSSYQAYEFWAISKKGLVRFDNRNWYEGDVFSLRSDDKVERKVKSFFGIENDEVLAEAVAKVAEFNSQMTLEELKSLRTDVMTHIPEDYSRLTEMNEAFDSLIIVYNECRIDWERANEILERFNDGMKDSTLKESECERINFAVQRSKSRFAPEEITIPFSALFEGELTSIASGGHTLMLGTTEGLYHYTGERWKKLNDLEGLPSTSITSLQVISGTYYIGTDNGLATYKLNRFSGFGKGIDEKVDSLANALNQDILGLEEEEETYDTYLPNGYVSAIGSGNASDIWVVIDNDLYRFDGETWSNSFIYTVAIDENPQSIAEKFLIYGSADEKNNFLDKLIALNAPLPDENVSTTPAEDAVPAEAVSDNDPEAEMPDSSQAQVTPSVELLIKPLEGDIEEMFVPPDMNSLSPGDKIKVPYLADIKGTVSCLYAANNDIWLGTDNGLIYFNGESWSLPGYKDYVVTEGVTLDTLLSGYYKMKHDSSLTDNYKKALMAINDLDETSLGVGDTISIYKNATATNINAIEGQSSKTYFATSDGLHMYDNKDKKLRPVTEKGMNKANSIFVNNIEDQLWLASDDQIVFNAKGRNELTLMVSKWLPDLAPDMYYAYASGTQNIQGWGTVGLSFTYLTYGEIGLTDASGASLGVDEPYEISAKLSFGTPLTKSLSGGVSAKIIYSLLSSQGELAGNTGGAALGSGSSFGMAVDLGLLYRVNPKLNLGLAITNLGPDLQYSQESQADPLPRNLAIGFSYKLLNSDYNRFLITAEANKSLVDVGELKEVIYNVGAEYVYADLIAPRVGYIYDEEGNVKTPTVGVGIYILNKLRFDFSYIPSSSSVALANTLRTSLTMVY